MTPQRFNKLTTSQQASFLWEFGTPVIEYYEPKFNCALYQVDDFYVEVKFNKLNLLLCRIHGFTHNCPNLDQYIKTIDISEVVCS